jgi:hypothetical protein
MGPGFGTALLSGIRSLRGRGDVADLAPEELPAKRAIDQMTFIGFGNRRQAEDVPILLFENMADEVILSQRSARTRLFQACAEFFERPSSGEGASGRSALHFQGSSREQTSDQSSHRQSPVLQPFCIAVSFWLGQVKTRPFVQDAGRKPPGTRTAYT